MKAAPPGNVARQPLRELQPSLQAFCGKNDETGDPSSGQTLAFSYAQKARAPDNLVSLWNLSSPNIPSTEQLVTLQQINDSIEEDEERHPGQSSLIAQLREQAATAGQTLKMKAFQLEEYERELELAHAKLEVLERKNEQLRVGFEQRLTKFEDNLHLKRPQPRAQAEVSRLKSIADSIPGLRVGVAVLENEILQLKQLCGKQFSTLRSAARRQAAQDAQSSLHKKEREIDAQLESELRLRLAEANLREHELLRVRDFFQKRNQKTAKTQRENSETIVSFQQRLKDLETALQAAATENADLSRKFAEEEARLNLASSAKIRKLKRKLCRSNCRLRSLRSLLVKRRSPAPKPRCRKHEINSEHACLSGRGLCARRQRIEALKLRLGL